MGLDQLLEWIPAGGPEESLARQVEFDRLPRHVAILIDGNGRRAGGRHFTAGEPASATCRASRGTAPASTPFETSSRPRRGSASKSSPSTPFPSRTGSVPRLKSAP